MRAHIMFNFHSQIMQIKLLFKCRKKTKIIKKKN